MSREKTEIAVQVCDFDEGLRAMVGELQEAYPEEVGLDLTAVRLIPGTWGYVDTPVGMFIVNEDGELIWLHMVNYVSVSVYPQYKNKYFEVEPKWKLDLIGTIFTDNYSGDDKNLAEFVRSGGERETRYSALKTVLEKAQTEDKLEIESLFMQLKEGSFWS